MRDFNRNNNSYGRGNNRSNDRSGGGGGGRFNDRDRGQREMHSATCADCGKNCRVPFRPTGDKPVYCSDCFEQVQNNERRSSGGDYNDRHGGGNDRRNGGHDRHDRGGRNDRPSYNNRDNDSYGGDSHSNSDKPSRRSKYRDSNELDEVNKKLNIIIEMLKAKKQPKTETKAEVKTEAKSETKKSKKTDKTEVEAKPKKAKSKAKPKSKKAVDVEPVFEAETE